MPETPVPWQIQFNDPPPDWFVQALKPYVPQGHGNFLAQLLWQRGLRDPDNLSGFLSPDDYQPASPFAFGEEMERAVDRLRQARVHQETVAIWGDFDADGVTATAILWEGLGQFFSQHTTLFYYIPNRITESHGLSRQGIDTLHRQGCRLIVTCDTGSTNLDEIQYASQYGIDVVVTDHHTLPSDRPPVTAIINPRYLSTNHPLAHLSGVAVAYKLVEAMYETLPEIPQKPLENLLDLVAIGLIADLVELRGDCRYLAQRGIAQLQKQSNPLTVTRPGVARLLEFCKRHGDRPTDISFGLGPRINAVSRIQGDAHFCIELLTSQDVQRCHQLAEATELANSRRKALQKDVAQQVTTRLSQLDLSTTGVIVLADEQWQPGVLGLVAGQVAQEYGRPTILLSTEQGNGEQAVGEEPEASPQQSEDADQGDRVTVSPSSSHLPHSPLPAPHSPPLARGSARSVHAIDLYQLVKEQQHLLHRFGGHPYAAGLSLPVDNIPLFTEAINQTLRQTSEIAVHPGLQVDLVITVANLGKDLFQELKLLEPCGMGNPVPRLLIRNCWFSNVWNQKLKDWKGHKVEYIKTEFEIWDDSVERGFPGIWWGHYRDEVPQGKCDVVVELDSNNYKKRYEVRLIAVRPAENAESNQVHAIPVNALLDWRGLDSTALLPHAAADPLILRHCPSSWAELQAWFQRSQQEQRPLAIAYAPPPQAPPQDIWERLVGIAKYLSRTGKPATRQRLLDQLNIGDRPLQLGCKTLTYLGFTLSYADNALQVKWNDPGRSPTTDPEFLAAIKAFFNAIQEDQFRRQYFYRIPLSTIQAVLGATS